MIMNLLPGLRELRAPLVSGYLYLVSAWLLLGHMEWLPSERPPGTGDVARLWDLGGALGKTVVLAVVTFAAYLIGSFLEMSPDGRMADVMRRIVLADRRSWYTRRGNASLAAVHDVEASLTDRISYFGKARVEVVVWYISTEARYDLMDLLQQRGELPSGVTRLHSLHDDPSDPRLRFEVAGDMIISNIVLEMPQLASRLLVKNQELYGKYDRQMAEASVRMNVSIPLALLLGLLVWLSGLSLQLRVALVLAVFTFGLILMRQGFLRAVSARDVIAQALVIGEVQSRHIPEEPSKGGGEEPAEPEGPMRNQIEDRSSAQ